MRVFVTSAAQISSIGISKEEVLASLRSNKSGIIKKGYGVHGEYYVGRVELSNHELCERFGVLGGYSRTTLLGIAAIKQMLPELFFIREGGVSSCLISGTSVGGMDYTEAEFKKYLNGQPYNKSVYANHACGTVTHQVMKNTIEVDMIDTVSTACSSAANAIIAGANHISAGTFDVAIVGGTDSLSEFTVAGFDSLKIYDSRVCRPFDEDRNGINLGEGAGFLLLESERSLSVSGNVPVVELKGWGSVSDAYHQTASSPDGFGATQAMKRALDSAGLKPSDISFINAHGTATLNNDLTESIAINNVFGPRIPPFGSTKSFTGHTLAASSGIESVFSSYSLLDGFLLPNLGYSSPIDSLGMVPNKEFKEGVGVNHILTNAFGFGGNNTSLIFSKL
jgi:3-oxoacyl-(acyl-carrier-protein) synthase